MKSVLIVDDFAYVLEILSGICKSFGFEIHVATVLCKSAEEAETAIVERMPDILFLDYQFNTKPGEENGANVARWIDRQYEFPIAVATHTLRDEQKARELFRNTKCVTHFVAQDPERIRVFLEYALSL